MLAHILLLFLLAVDLPDGLFFSDQPDVLRGAPSDRKGKPSFGTRISAKEQDCLAVSDILSYKVLKQSKVGFYLKDQRVVVAVLETCPDLMFHRYVSYVPTNGQLCKGRDHLLTREGYRCSIKEFVTMDKDQ